MNWTTINTILINISFILLFCGLISSWITIAFPQVHRLKILNKSLVQLVNLILAIILGSRWLINGYFPLSNLYESLIFLTWCLTLAQLTISQKINSQIVHAISLPVDLFIIAFTSLSLPTGMQQANSLVPALRSNWLMMHVTVMILSYALLLIGSLLSILFLIIAQGRRVNLRGDSIGYLVNTSSMTSQPTYSHNNNRIRIEQKNNMIINLESRMNFLESLDNLSYRTIGLGFPLLTLGIISGSVWANEAWGSYWSWDPKETWALITWLVFAAYLHSRLTKSWAGKKPAVLASIGFFIVWICYLGVNFLGQGLHSYGWVS
uniref:Cytochrome c biogenesis protein CcsA n=1 Tax=Trichogloeopsis pedicellata TaxID=1495610 RepID=A0A1G4P0D1_9FLOR|nr:Cytochrome c biogenesis protein ccs1 [Trichogloeopsis pedicellata]SCW24368.1 Cytochrome c biogenesis protein ccs1 [Trichogloeopsis pedicellata]